VAQKILKRWSRAGVEPFIMESISNASYGMNLILVVGGRGPILDFIEKQYSSHSIVTLDINPDFKPDIVADLSEESLASKIQKTCDLVLIVEVLEHIPKYEEALDNVYQLLKPGGLLVGTTPWSTPLHDKPFDFFRYES
jgi:SAM-dependent methyltransferase